MKQALMIAGPNGAGKTTTAMALLPYLGIFEFVNADELARGLNPLNPDGQAIAAGKLMLRRMEQLTGEGKSFAFETTASGLTHVKTIQACKAAGFTTELLFVYLAGYEMAIQRVADRVKSGGHSIPPDVIERRYTKGIHNLIHHYLHIFDKVTVVNNTKRAKGGIPPTIAKKNAGQALEIYDKIAWQRILEIAS